MNQVKVNVLFFAKSRELTGTSRATITLEQDQLTGEQLLEYLIGTFPK